MALSCCVVQIMMNDPSSIQELMLMEPRRIILAFGEAFNRADSDDPGCDSNRVTKSDFRKYSFNIPRSMEAKECIGQEKQRSGNTPAVLYSRSTVHDLIDEDKKS